MEEKGAPSLLVLVGSQTGTAEELGGRLAFVARKHGLASRLLPFDQYDMHELPKESLVAICCSTYGTGTFPANTQKAWDVLCSLTAEGASFAGLRFGVFGLGNKNTRHDFNSAAKKLHAKLLQLGATEVYKLGLGCELDPDGHYTAFLPWMIGFFSGIDGVRKESLEKDALHITSALYTVTSSLASSNESNAGQLTDSLTASRRIQRRRPPPGYTYVKLKRNKRVTPEDYIRRIYRAGISLKHTTLSYEVGDHISVLPQNEMGSTSAFMRFYDLDPTASITITPAVEGLPPLKITQPLTVGELLTKYLDLFGRPTKHLIRYIAQSLTAAEKVKLLHITDDPMAWESFNAEFPSACDILLRYSSVRLTLSELVTFIPLIRPRLYSIISCPKLHHKQVRFIYLCREWRAPGGRTVKGLATSHLSRLKRKQDVVAVNIQKGVFRYNKQKAKAPLMFVALGTGVATAISLLHLRKALLDEGATLGSMVLFYGCRHKDQDFLFQKELDAFVQNGVLNEVIPAFSHDQEERVFVQDKVHEKKGLVASYIQHKEALYYYCGLGGVVPFLIEEAIGESLVTVGKSQHDAEAVIAEMKHERRWFVEAYSATLTKNLELEVIEKHDTEEVRAPVIFSERGNLRAGSLEKVIEWVCSKPLTSDRNEIWSDRDAFLLCYRQYCSPEQLLERITSLVATYSLHSGEENVSTKAFIANVIDFMHRWADNWAVQDFGIDLHDESSLGAIQEEHENSLSRPEPLSIKLLKFVTIVAKDQVPRFTEALDKAKFGAARKKKMLQTVRDSRSNTSNSTLSRPTHTPRDLSDSNILQRFQKRRSDPSVLKDMTCNLVSGQIGSVLDFDSDELALHLTFKEQQRYNKIMPLDLLVNIKHPVAMIGDFARASNRVSGWVATEIVTAPDEKGRVAIIEAFIRIAQSCWELHSFNTAMDIISGLNSFSISRLKQTWDLVSARGHETLDGLVAGMDPAGNFRNYRSHVESLAPPLIPYIALVLRDLTFANDGNPSFLEGDLINFERMTLFFSIITDILKCQLLPQHQILVNETALSFLHGVEVFDEDRLYKRSLEIQSSARKDTGEATKKDEGDIEQTKLVRIVHRVVACQDIKALKVILDAQPDIINIANDRKKTPLHLASTIGNAKVVALLLEDKRGVLPDLRDINGDTALHFAASHNHLKIVKMLLKKGASVNILNEKEVSPLDVATPSVQAYLKVSLFKPMFETLKREMVLDEKSGEKNRSLMVWTDSLSVGVKKFDKAHKRLVEYVNVLYAIIGTQEKDKRKNQISSLLRCLVDYTHYHFAQEEELFARFGYPDEAGHVRKHKHVEQFCKLHQKGKNINLSKLAKFLREWLLHHIMEDDMKYKPFFHQHNIY